VISPVGETGRVAEEVLHGHRALCGLGVVARDDLHLGELRQELRYRVDQLECALLHEDQRYDRGEWLGHRVDAEDRVVRHRFAVVRVELAERRGIGELPVAGDHDDGAGESPKVDLGAKGGLDAVEPVGRCQSASNLDPRLECAPWIGQIERLAIDRGRAF
jgi:hypothetical protein